MNLTKLSKRIYNQNVTAGWWDNGDRCLFQLLQLVSTEVCEATEGERKNLMDDHLPHRKMGEVELADALIRLLDIGGRYDWPVLEFIDRSLFSYTTRYRVEGAASLHFCITIQLAQLGNHVDCFGVKSSLTKVSYSRLVSTIIEVAEFLGYDIYAALEEKLAYNKTRKDHTREARAASDGKKF